MQMLSTNRLTLRPLAIGDSAFLIQLLSDPDVRRYLGGPVDVVAITRHLADIQSEASIYPCWTVLHVAQPIGLISLTPHKDGIDTEVSYQFLPTVWRCGFATEAALAVIRYGLRYRNLDRIPAETQLANVAFIALLKRLGMVEIDQIERFGAMQVIFATSG